MFNPRTRWPELVTPVGSYGRSRDSILQGYASSPDYSLGNSLYSSNLARHRRFVITKVREQGESQQVAELLYKSSEVHRLSMAHLKDEHVTS